MDTVPRLYNTRTRPDSVLASDRFEFFWRRSALCARNLSDCRCRHRLFWSSSNAKALLRAHRLRPERGSGTSPLACRPQTRPSLRRPRLWSARVHRTSPIALLCPNQQCPLPRRPPRGAQRPRPQPVHRTRLPPLLESAGRLQSPRQVRLRLRLLPNQLQLAGSQAIRSRAVALRRRRPRSRRQVVRRRR
jgi:hypothetical protein